MSSPTNVDRRTSLSTKDLEERLSQLFSATPSTATSHEEKGNFGFLELTPPPSTPTLSTHSSITTTPQNVEERNSYLELTPIPSASSTCINTTRNEVKDSFLELTPPPSTITSSTTTPIAKKTHNSFLELTPPPTNSSSSLSKTPSKKQNVNTSYLPLTPPLSSNTTPALEHENPFPPPLPLKPTPEHHHHTEISPKTQHFSRSLLLFFLHPSTLTQIGQAQARYIDRSALFSLANPPKSKSKNMNKKKGKAKKKKRKKEKEKEKGTFNFAKLVQELNDGNSDGLALASEIFNSDGTVKRDVEGKWGKELNKGAILVLNFILVEEEWRRFGFGRDLIYGLIERAREMKGGVRWVFVKPGVIMEDLRVGEEEYVALERAKGFYMGVGFREVGGDGWLCLDAGDVVKV